MSPRRWTRRQRPQNRLRGCEFGTYRHWFDDGVCIEQIAVEVHAIFAAHCKSVTRGGGKRTTCLLFLTRK